MSISLPAWIADFLFPGAVAGEETWAELILTWPWPAWSGLLLAVLLVTAAVWSCRWSGAEAPWLMRWTCLCLRLGAIIVLAFMLAQASLLARRTGRPTVAVLIDTSASMATLDGDSATGVSARAEKPLASVEKEISRLEAARRVLLADGGALIDRLSERYRVAWYEVADQARPADPSYPSIGTWLASLQPTGQTSQHGAAVRGLLERPGSAGPIAIVLFSDGIVTEGESLYDAALAAKRRNVPLHVVALGGAHAGADVALTDLRVDEQLPVGSVARFDFLLTAQGMPGAEARVELHREDVEEALDARTVPLSEGRLSIPLSLAARLDREGEFAFRIKATSPGDRRPENDALRVQVRAVRDRIKVLYVQGQPSFEFRFLKTLLERDESVDLICVLQSADPGYVATDRTAASIFPVAQDEVFGFDVILLGDADPAPLGARGLTMIRDFVARRGGGLILLSGPRDNPRSYRDTVLAPLFPVDLASLRLPPEESALVSTFRIVPGAVAGAFPWTQLGETSLQSSHVWNRLPPMYWLAECPDLRPAAQVLLQTHDRRDENGAPLPVVAFQYFGAGRVLWQATDEFWRWRFRSGEQWLSRYWGQAIRFMARAGVSGGASLSTDRGTYFPTDVVRFQARVVPSAERSSGEDSPRVEWEWPDGSRHWVAMTRRPDDPGRFEGLAANPPIGEHRAWLSHAGGSRPQAVQFTVRPPSGELDSLSVDLGDIRRIAELSGGRAYPPDRARNLWQHLPADGTIPLAPLPPVQLWSRWPTMMLFLGLLVTEWLVRRRAGWS